MREALRRVRGRPVTLHAQTRLTGWYRQFGFVVSAPEYVEDGIPHTPMRYGG
jgi:ElaA protein